MTTSTLASSGKLTPMRSDKAVVHFVCLEWHLDDNANFAPRKVLCGLDRQQARFLIRVNRLAVALAKSQDHRASCGVFAFGLPSAVRRWLGMGYPDTRASQIRERGLRIERGGRAKACKSVQRKRWHGSEGHTSKRSGICDLSRYRLRFAPTFTKGQL